MRRIAGNFEHARSRRTHRFHPGIIRIDNRDAVDGETVTINVWLERPDRDAPHPVIVSQFFRTAWPFAADLDRFGLGRAQTERDGLIGMNLWRNNTRHIAARR